MGHLQYYRDRLRPKGQLDWRQWRADNEQRLVSQAPIRFVDPLSAEAIFDVLRETPEPSYQEVVTGAFVADYLLSSGLRLSPLTGMLPFETHLVFGRDEGPFDLALRCDLDAVATGEGGTRYYAHACGHATNMAALLSLTPFLVGIASGRVALIFQPAEEGPGREEDGYIEPNGYGGGQYLRRKGIYRKVRRLVSCHLDAKLRPDEVRISPGVATAAAYRFTYHAEGYPCHAALPGNGSNPIDGVQKFLNALDELRQELRSLPSDEYGLVTPTQIRTSANDLNTLPKSAWVNGIVRVVGGAALQLIQKYIPTGVVSAAVGDDRSILAVNSSFELEAPPVQNDPELAGFASEVARARGLTVIPDPARFRDETAWAGRFDQPWVENPSEWPTGCDKILHFFVSPGLQSGGLHTMDFTPDREAVNRQAGMIKGIVERTLASGT